MDGVRELHDKLQRWFSETSKWVAWVGVPRLVGGLVAIATGVVVVFLILQVPAPPIENALLRAGVTTSVGAPLNTADTQPSIISRPLFVTVHVVGAVHNPGVYVLSAGSRANDALRRAGGATSNADTASVNLASIVHDGDQLYIPARRVLTSAPPRRLQVMSPSTRATASTSVPLSTATSGGDKSGVVSSNSVVSLSTASEKELESLPGVGPATASAIVAHRRAHGPFRRVDDLLNVKGIGESKLAAIRSRIVP